MQARGQRGPPRLPSLPRWLHRGTPPSLTRARRRSLKHLPGFVEKAEAFAAKARRLTWGSERWGPQPLAPPPSRHLYSPPPALLPRISPFPAQGVDALVCVSVNDPFVMNAWAKSLPGAKDRVLFLADGSAQLATALGLQLDLTEKGLGVRSRRYAMLLDDGVVKLLKLEEGGALTVSSADDVLAAL